MDWNALLENKYRLNTFRKKQLLSLFVSDERLTNKKNVLASKEQNL